MSINSLSKNYEPNQTITKCNFLGKQENSLKASQTHHKHPFSNSTLWKMVMMSLMFSGAQSSACNKVSTDQSCLASNNLPHSYTTTPPDLTPSIQFEDYVKGFVHTEDWIVKTNRQETYSCKITPPDFQEFKNCKEIAEDARYRMLKNPQYKAKVFSPDAFHQKGFTLFLKGAYINLNVNPKLRENYEKALTLAEEKVLTPDFVNSDIEMTLKTLNKVLVEDLKTIYNTPIKGGVYRERLMFIQPEDQANNIEAFVKEKYGKKALKTFRSARDKVVSTESLETLNPKEKKIWEAAFYTCPSHKEVPYLMKEFVKEYRQKLKDQCDPISLAAWVHMQIVNIHPYEDAHGRLARIMMNAELKRGGLKPVVILDDKAYTQAIQNEQKYKIPQAFEQYLKNLCQKNLSFSHLKSLSKLA